LFFNLIAKNINMQTDSSSILVHVQSLVLTSHVSLASTTESDSSTFFPAAVVVLLGSVSFLSGPPVYCDGQETVTGPLMISDFLRQIGFHVSWWAQLGYAGWVCEPRVTKIICFSQKRSLNCDFYGRSTFRSSN
jgi:hypothetical protein